MGLRAAIRRWLSNEYTEALREVVRLQQAEITLLRQAYMNERRITRGLEDKARHVIYARSEN